MASQLCPRGAPAAMPWRICAILRACPCSASAQPRDRPLRYQEGKPRSVAMAWLPLPALRCLSFLLMEPGSKDEGQGEAKGWTAPGRG